MSSKERWLEREEGKREKRREAEGGKVVKSRPRLLTRLNPGSALKVGSGAWRSAAQGTGAKQEPDEPMADGAVGLRGVSLSLELIWRIHFLRPGNSTSSPPSWSVGWFARCCIAVAFVVLRSCVVEDFPDDTRNASRMYLVSHFARERMALVKKKKWELLALGYTRLATSFLRVTICLG